MDNRIQFDDLKSSLVEADRVIAATLSEAVASPVRDKIRSASDHLAEIETGINQLADERAKLSALTEEQANLLNRTTNSLLKQIDRKSAVWAVLGIVISIIASTCFAYVGRRDNQYLLDESLVTVNRHIEESSKADKRLRLINDKLGSLNGDVLAEMMATGSVEQKTSVDNLANAIDHNKKVVEFIRDSRLFDLSAIDKKSGKGAAMMRRICALKRLKPHDPEPNDSKTTADNNPVTVAIRINSTGDRLWIRSPSHDCWIVPEIRKANSAYRSYNVYFNITSESFDEEFPLILDVVLFEGFVENTSDDVPDGSWAAAHLISGDMEAASFAMRFPDGFDVRTGALTYRDSLDAKGVVIPPDKVDTALLSGNVLWYIFKSPSAGFYFFDWEWDKRP